MTATDDPDDSRFNDPKLEHLFNKTYDTSVVMNDGTSTISAYAMRELCQASDDAGEGPSMVQGRHYGDKGTWLREKGAATFLDNAPPPKIKMQTSKSQVKIHQGNNEDDVKSRFGIIGCNLPPKPSILHVPFLPILHHGGVPAEDICDYVTMQLREWVLNLKQSLRDRNAFSSMASRAERSHDRRRSHGGH